MIYAIIIMIGILFIDVIPAFKQKDRKEIIVVVVLSILSSALMITYAITRYIPSPMTMIHDFFDKVVKLKY